MCSKVFQCIYIVFQILYPCKLLNIESSFLCYTAGPKNRVPISSVQLSCVWLFATPWLLHARLPCPSPALRACSNSCPSSQWCHPSIILSHPPPSFNLSQYQSLFQWVSFSCQEAKVLELQFQYQSFQWIFLPMNIGRVTLWSYSPTPGHILGENSPNNLK